MFKSIFAKYVTTFMALLLTSFLLLIFIVNSVVSNYSLRAEEGHVRGVSISCAENLAELYGYSPEIGLEAFIDADVAAGKAGHIDRLLNAIMTNFEDMTVYVTDARGGFIFCTGNAAEAAPARGTVILDEAYLVHFSNPAPAAALPQATASAGSRLMIPAHGATKSTADPETADTIPGAFIESDSLPDSPRSLAYATPVPGENGIVVGHVVVTSTAESWSSLTSDTLRSVAVAGLWILLAALIAIYFITERTIAPLREIRRAARCLAVGEFDARVQVHGHDEVAELAVAFNRMATDIESLDRMRNSFVANVSHDLRTPMTTIAGFIDGILDGVIPADQQEHYLRVVSDEVRRLSRLVTALLDVSRLQAGDRKFDMQPFDVCELGRQILISFEQKIDDKHLDVCFDCEEERMFVLADRDAIHQILYNICDNAIKFSIPGGKLQMSFVWSQLDGSRARKAVVSVYNEGQGIPPEDLPFVFERFYKSDKSRSLDKTGVGLGMFISKTIIEAHKETITADSEYGQNCTFTFTLARTEPPTPKSRAGSVPGGTYE